MCVILPISFSAFLDTAMYCNYILFTKASGDSALPVCCSAFLNCDSFIRIHCFSLFLVWFVFVIYARLK